jgi:hypothetical protein
MACGKAAPALATAGTISYLGCRGVASDLQVSINSGAGWTAPVSAGGRITYGPGIAAFPDHGAYFVEGLDHAVWQFNINTTGGLISELRLGGSVKLGAAAGAV